MSSYTIDLHEIQVFLTSQGFICELKGSTLIATLPDTKLRITISLRKMTIVDEYTFKRNILKAFQKRQLDSKSRQILFGSEELTNRIQITHGDLTDYETSLAMIRGNRDKVIELIRFFITLNVIPLFYLIGLTRNQSQQDILMYVIVSATEVKIEITE